MTSKVPVRVVFDGSNNATGLAEFQSGEFVPLTHGGLGASLSLGTAGQVLKVNSGATALEFSSDAGIGLTNLSVGSEASASGNGAIAYNNSTGVFTYTPPVLSGLSGDTDNISEGSSNLYFTNARARGAISVTGSGSYNSSTGVITVTGGVTSVNTATGAVTLDTDDISEGSSNLYFTNARARGSISASGSLSYNSGTGALSYTQGAIDADSVTVSNIEVDNLKAGVLDTDISSVASTDTTLASAKAIKTYVDAQLATKDALSELSGDTDDVSEGSTNLYFTNARARGAISVTDSGGDGSLAYNNSTGVITYTGPSASEVRAHISGGTGVTISNGEIAIGQDVGTSDNVTFNNATIAGNLTVSGTTTTVSSTNTLITDKLVELANGQTGTPSGDIGHVFERGNSDNAFIGFDESEDKFIVGTGTFTGASTGNLTITKGTLLANVEGNVTGDVTGNADTATTLETARNIGGVSFNGSANIDLPGVNTAGNQNTSGTAAVATTVTVTDNESTNENNVILFGAGAAGSGNIGIEADGNMTYNPSTGKITATGFVGALTGDVTGNADTATTLATARNIAGQSFDGSANITIGLTDIGISDGTADQVLTTDGAGNFTFEDPSGGSGFTVSTITIAPSSEGNFDLAKSNNQGAVETPFDSTATDAFGVAIGFLFDCMEPTGTGGTTTDLGAFS